MMDVTGQMTLVWQIAGGVVLAYIIIFVVFPFLASIVLALTELILALIGYSEAKRLQREQKREEKEKARQIAFDKRYPTPPKETATHYLVFAIKLVGTFVGLCFILYLLSKDGT